MPTIRRSYTLGVAALVFLVVLAAGQLWPGGRARAVPPPRPASAAAPAALVHVVGAVLRPGVYRLAAGSRVQDALRAAGGARRTAALDQVNLAAVVADGEQIAVPRRGRRATAAAGAATPPVVHLNTADAAALDVCLASVRATAARIVAFRAAHGPFLHLEDLLEVPGIGPAKLEAMRAQLTL